MEGLQNHTAVWLLVGLLLGWLFRDVIKSAFEKFTGVFWNPIYQAPDVHWKGIDQDLFENPDFSVTPMASKGTCKCGKKSKMMNDVYKTAGQKALEITKKVKNAKEGMCGCAVNEMYDWDGKKN